MSHECNKNPEANNLPQVFILHSRQFIKICQSYSCTFQLGRIIVREKILISIDAEFTGRMPGVNSMISLGAVAYTQAGKEISSFKVNIAELAGSLREKETMEWWSTQPLAWATATIDPKTPRSGMIFFANWLIRLPGNPKLMGWPLPVDFMYIKWYYENFVGEAPFGFDGIDIKSFAMGKLDLSIDEISRSLVRKRLGIPNRAYSHDPCDDARDQAELYFGLRALP